MSEYVMMEQARRCGDDAAKTANHSPVSCLFSSKYRITMGVEVHVQALGGDCKAKVFSYAAADNNELTPNKNISPIDYGLPGALPVMNIAVARLAVRAALALGCDINRTSRFDNKHYFYVDLPCGRQTTQFYQPIALGGCVPVVSESEEYSRKGTKVQINRIHIEQDAGKSLHDIYPDCTAVDYNRAGIGLLEIVTEPCINSIEDLVAFVKSLRAILRRARVSECNMERGEMRVDLSISVRKHDQEALGTRVEIKNLNSINTIIKAAEYEFNRQCRLVESGKQVVQETRLFSVAEGATQVMRTKEDALDYMYIPESNLPSLELSEEFIERERREMQPLPHQACSELVKKYGIGWSNAYTIASEPEYFEFFAKVVAGMTETQAQVAAKWMIGDLFGLLDQPKHDLAKFNYKWLVEIAELLDANQVSGKSAKELLRRAVEGDRSPRTVAKECGMEQVFDTDQIATVVDRVLAENPKEVERYRSGELKLLGFFVGQSMKQISSANPGVLTKTLKEKLGI